MSVQLSDKTWSPKFTRFNINPLWLSLRPSVARNGRYDLAYVIEGLASLEKRTPKFSRFRHRGVLEKLNDQEH